MIERSGEISKYAFIGAQSVGKTTMTNIFRDRYAGNPHVVVLEEEARKFFDSNPTADRSLHVQEQIQDRVLAEEQRAHAQPDTKLVIADRSVIDPIVLTSIWGTPESTRKLYQRVSRWLPTYTSFILLNPAGVPSEAEPNRRETEEERIAIHNAFGDFCNEKGLPLIEISGTIQERTEKVEGVIFEHLPERIILAETQQSRSNDDNDKLEKKPADSNTIAIIGGGFSGLSVASHLIQEVTGNRQGVAITLFEPNKVDGGIPYNTDLPPSFRLNHETVNMGVVSPFSKDAGYDDFYQWVQAKKDKPLDMLDGDSIENRYRDFDLVDPGAYLPRSLYGYYLRDRFETLLARNETEDYHFTHRKGLATDITRDETGFTVFENNTSSHFSQVVLSTGDYFNSREANMLYASSPHEYLDREDIIHTHEIGILGSSLSGIETAITLAERGYENITMFSRAGRIPKVRGKTSEYEPTHVNAYNIDSLRDISGKIDPYEIARLFKKELDHAYATKGKGLYQTQGINWREITLNEDPLKQLDEDVRAVQIGEEVLWRSVLASTVAIQPDIWNWLSTNDCREVLGKYTSFILSYFAPMPLTQAEKLQTHLKNGSIKLRSDIVGYEPLADGWKVSLNDDEEVAIKHLIDARGFSHDASQNVLIASLIDSGLVEKHPINGIRANKQSQVTKDGDVVDNLYAIGALLYGERPLNAATPTITKYAKEIATQIAKNL